MKKLIEKDLSFTDEYGIFLRVYHIGHRIKLYAKLENNTVIEYGSTPHEAAEKAKKSLIKCGSFLN
jgi:GTP cyclohydrolase III